MNMKRSAIKLYLFLSGQMGFDPIRLLRSIRGLPFFLSDWINFRRHYTGRLTLSPFLHDRFQNSGVTESEYFWQDLLVAQWIFQNNPEKHVDVGSRIDGFVAHVASFRQLEVIDIRPMRSSIPGVSFSEGDLMQELPPNKYHPEDGYCDSLSCLHSLEHFGLGRYGDPIDVYGYKKGFSNLASLLKIGGVFYLSTPIGIDRVEFNANRVFDPRKILELADACRLSLDSLVIIENGKYSTVSTDRTNLEHLAAKGYSLGLFTFKRV